MTLSINHMDMAIVHIELYDFEGAACSTKVRWTLAETGLAWTRHRIDFLAFEHKQRRYLDIHPKGLVPAAKFDGVVMLEADAIMRRIAQLAPECALWPESERARAQAMRALEMVAQLHPYYGQLYYHHVFMPMLGRWPAARLDAALAQIEDTALRLRMAHLAKHRLPTTLVHRARDVVQDGLNALEVQLAHSPTGWLSGQSFSIADIGLLPYVHAALPCVERMWQERLPALEQWLARMRARPAFDKAITGYPLPPELVAANADALAGG